jgi:O6-methylguanine-DNA--protein-cysteine methyltransferase
MDQLQDLGLATPEQQAELQQRVWKVMFLVPYGLFWQYTRHL